MENNTQSFRHEWKHMINKGDAFAIGQRLEAIAKQDPFAGPDGKYSVRSLYFDNFEDKALREKIDGVNHREKFRIRFYNFDPSFIRLEKKSKTACLCSKMSANITQQECECLLRGQIHWMREKKDPLFLELYTKMVYQQLRPKTIVDYTRQAFVYPVSGVRITLDGNIRTGLSSLDLFNRNLSTMPVENLQILEVKYNAFLPEIIADFIQVQDRQTTAYSKYAACRRWD